MCTPLLWRVKLSAGSGVYLALPAGEALVAGDEARAAGEGEVSPDPGGEDREAVAEADEEEDVDREPGGPGGKAAPVGFEGPFDFGDGVHAADGGHVALVEVAKGGARASGEIGSEDSGDMVAHLHGRLSDAGDLMAVLLEVGQIAQNEDLGHARRIETTVYNDAAAVVERRAQQAAQRRGGNASGPEGHGCIDARTGSVGLGFDPARPDGGDMGMGVDLDAQAAQRGFGFGGKVFGISSQNARRTFEQQDAGFRGIDVAEVVAHIELGNVGDGSGQLDAGGSAADDDEIERWVPAVLDHLALGQFEGEQHTAANLGGVFDGFESWRKRSPVVAAEVGVGGTGGQHQVVVRELGAAGQGDLPRIRVNADYLVHEHLGVLLVAQNCADGLSDVGRREDREGDLIEERLEGVMVAAVHEGYVHGQAGKASGCMNACKAAADDDYAGTVGERLLKRSGQFAQIVNLSIRRCGRGAISDRRDVFWFVEGWWGSWFPTLAARNKDAARMGHL